MYIFYGIMPVGHLKFECPTGGTPGQHTVPVNRKTQRKVVQHGIFSHNNERGFFQ